MKTVDELLNEEFEQMELRRLTFDNYLDKVAFYLIQTGQFPQEAAHDQR